MTYVNEASWGDLKELLKDVGINKHSIRFNNVADILKSRETYIMESDKNWRVLANQRFQQLDMTDYEFDFPSVNEVPDLEYFNLGALNGIKPEAWPNVNALIEINDLENPLVNATGRTHRELLEGRSAEEEEEEEDEDEDEDEDEEEEEGEEDEEDEDDEEEEDDGEPEFREEQQATMRQEDRFFRGHEKLRDKYSDVELNAFMNLLNMKPYAQWEDETTHHYKLGTHEYEDESQMHDPYFHLLAEVERKHMERQQTLDFRRGTEVKFVLDPKKRPQYTGN